MSQQVQNWSIANAEDIHTIVKFVESTLAAGLMFMHSGELLTISSKEFSMVYVTCFTAFPVFLMARMTAAGYKCRWLPMIIDAVFVFLSSLAYVTVFVYVAADLGSFSNVRQGLALETQLTHLNQDVSIVRMVFLAVLAFILFLDAALQIIPPVWIAYGPSRDKKKP